MAWEERPSERVVMKRDSWDIIGWIILIISIIVLVLTCLFVGYTIIISIISPLAVVLAVYLLNERSKRKLFKEQAKEQREFEKAKKKYDVKLERYEQLSKSLYKMVMNLNQLKLLMTKDWDNINNLETNINLAFNMGVLSMEDERILETSGIKKSFHQYNELIKNIDSESKKGKEKLLEWMSILVETLIWLRLRLFNMIEYEFWSAQSSLELINRNKEIRQKAFNLGETVFEELANDFLQYKSGKGYTIELGGFIDRMTNELKILREMMLDDIEKTL